MSFSDVVKQHTDEKYLKLGSGTTERSITDATIVSCEEYVKKNDQFQLRLKREKSAILNAANEVRATYDARIRKIEEERLAAERAEQERIRKIEEARLAAERAEQEKVLAAERAERERLQKIEDERLAKERAEKEKILAAERAEKERIRREEMARQEEENRIKRAKEKKKNTIIGIVVLIAMILGLVLLVRGCNAKYSVDNIDITVVEKYNSSSQSNKVRFTLVFEVENKGSLDIHQLVGDLKIYNSRGDSLLSDTLTLNGVVKPDNMLQFEVDLNLSATSKSVELYETDLSGLKITLRLTEVTFEDNNKKEYKNGKEKILSAIGNEYIEGMENNEKTYNQAVSLFNEGKYIEAIPLFKALGSYQDSSDYYVKSIYNNALSLFAQEKYKEAAEAFYEVIDYSDSAEKIEEIIVAATEKAEEIAATGDYAGAYTLLGQVGYDDTHYIYQAYQYAEAGRFDEAVSLGLTVVVFPEGTEMIPDNYFKTEYGTSYLEKVVLPSSLKSIGTSAFYGCKNLTEINLPNGLQVIKNYAFYNCRSLKNIEIPDSVESMGSNVFQECTGLQTVSIPSSLKTVPAYVFKDCTNLTTVTLKNGIEVFDIGAFSGCSSLVNITLPDSLIKIESNVFSKCTSLIEITIPAKVNVIGYSAFASCSSLQRVHFANQEGWQYEYSNSAIDVTNAQANAKELRSITSSTWLRK